MNERQRPLLLFPQPTTSEREKRNSGFARMRLPSAPRQGERLGPKFDALRSNFDARRLQLQAAAPNDEPELVVVFETAGSVENFVQAVRNIPGLEWLLDSDEDGIVPDDDFFNESDHAKLLSGRIYLLGSNHQALNEVISLWNRYQANPQIKLAHGLGKWKDVFKHLRDVRFWGAQDRIRVDARQYLESRLAGGHSTIRFEVEAWCYSSATKNASTTMLLTQHVNALGGRVLQSALIESIAYHGFLIELPAQGVRSLLSDAPPALVLSERVMFFRPHGQAISAPSEDETRLESIAPPAQLPTGQPVVALLDGLPLQNHPLLAGRLTIDDPDGWELGYPASERNHGTAMASLLLHGELDTPGAPLVRPVYARPIMRPDANDFRQPRREATPDDTLLIDVVHRAVRRMFEGEGDNPAVAPTIKVINLSVGDVDKPFDGELSPWARLLDWLAAKYLVLFVVSAGNVSARLNLRAARGTLSSIEAHQRQHLALSALLTDSIDRRLLTPAESINAITVGAVHADSSTFVQVADRFDLFPMHGVSPYSGIGHGFKRTVKPDILLPGGRALHRENLAGDANADTTDLALLDTPAAPGHRVAAPDIGGQNTKYTRGTSNATAFATRGAALAHAVIEELRAGYSHHLPARFDAVLLKALLVHGTQWGKLESQILNARPDVTDWRQKQSLVTRFLGYGVADIERAITCTEQRATLIGVGELQDGNALEFRVPMPPSLNAQVVKRRLTITLAWMSPINARSAKYRAARLWVNPPASDFQVGRTSYDWQQVQRGTVQHEVLENENAIVFSDGEDFVFKVNCAEDAGTILAPVAFALCVTLEVAEGVDLPIYQEIRERVTLRVGVGAT